MARLGVFQVFCRRILQLGLFGWCVYALRANLHMHIFSHNVPTECVVNVYRKSTENRKFSLKLVHTLRNRCGLLLVLLRLVPFISSLFLMLSLNIFTGSKLFFAWLEFLYAWKCATAPNIFEKNPQPRTHELYLSQIHSIARLFAARIFIILNRRMCKVDSGTKCLRYKWISFWVRIFRINYKFKLYRTCSDFCSHAEQDAENEQQQKVWECAKYVCLCVWAVWIVQTIQRKAWSCYFRHVNKDF